VTSDIQRFFEDKVPGDWFAGPSAIESDDDEIHYVGILPPGVGVDTFRERTRPERMAIAQEAESRFGRKVSWGVERDGVTTMFTTQTTPVMTRLRLPERTVLDTLIDAGVARSRSDALAWCVRLVGRHQAEWLTDLREALVGVEQAREEGPTLI
jgi:chloramphenicol 3-O-phosphotransferase